MDDQPLAQRAHHLERPRREQVGPHRARARHRRRDRAGLVRRVGIGEEEEVAPGR